MPCYFIFLGNFNYWYKFVVFNEILSKDITGSAEKDIKFYAFILVRNLFDTPRRHIKTSRPLSRVKIR